MADENAKKPLPEYDWAQILAGASNPPKLANITPSSSAFAATSVNMDPSTTQPLSFAAFAPPTTSIDMSKLSWAAITPSSASTATSIDMSKLSWAGITPASASAATSISTTEFEGVKGSCSGEDRPLTKEEEEEEYEEYKRFCAEIQPPGYSEYLDQWTSSEGFDVDIVPPGMLGLGIYLDMTKVPENELKGPYNCAKEAIEKYNNENNADFELKKLVKFNKTVAAGFMFYLTFEAESKSEGVVSTFQAKVWWAPPSKREGGWTADVRFCRKRKSTTNTSL